MTTSKSTNGGHRWKMPEWMREIFNALKYQSPDGTLYAVDSLLTSPGKSFQQEYWRGIKEFAQDARAAGLLNTPDEAEEFKETEDALELAAKKLNKLQADNDRLGLQVKQLKKEGRELYKAQEHYEEIAIACTATAKDVDRLKELLQQIRKKAEYVGDHKLVKQIDRVIKGGK